MSAPRHPMRRRDRELGEADAWAILAKAEWGVLSTVDAEGWPYGVPLNHVVVDGALVLHAARDGHKLANLAANPRVSYCVVTGAEPLPEELSTRYESALAFGTAEVVQDEAERQRLLLALGHRFAPMHPEAVTASVAKDGFRTAVLRIAVERVSAKARR